MSAKNALGKERNTRASFTAVAKPITYFHIGRKVPRGFVEVGKSIQLGKGIWMLRMMPKRAYNLLKARRRA